MIFICDRGALFSAASGFTIDSKFQSCNKTDIVLRLCTSFSTNVAFLPSKAKSSLKCTM